MAEEEAVAKAEQDKVSDQSSVYTDTQEVFVDHPREDPVIE